MAILITIAFLFTGILRLILVPLWHFRTISIKEAYTLHGEYIFEDFSWKELFVYKDEKNEDNS